MLEIIQLTLKTAGAVIILIKRLHLVVRLHHKVLTRVVPRTICTIYNHQSSSVTRVVLSCFDLLRHVTAEAQLEHLMSITVLKAAPDRRKWQRWIKYEERWSPTFAALQAKTHAMLQIQRLLGVLHRSC